ncbi:MAG: rhomboid family intramembrane serine protease [Bacillota bacterium]
MDLLRRLERRFGRYAIRGLMSYIVGGNALVYVFGYLDQGGALLEFLALDPAKVLQGELWRLVSFVFIPPSSSPLFILFVLYFYYLIGTSLEREWGTARFNLYYLAGMVGTILAAFITGGGATAFYLNLSLFLAFARLFPDFEFRLFFVLPVKAKHLAWIDWGFLGLSLLTAAWPEKGAVLASILNFFLFFGGDLPAYLRRRQLVRQNRRRLLKALEATPPKRVCAVCGKTDKSHPWMVFRTCKICGLDLDYCEEHLEDHIHRTVEAGQEGDKLEEA